LRPVIKSIAVLCLLLTLWSAAAYVMHDHTSATDAEKCAVCVAAHSTSPTFSSALPNAIFVPIAAVTVKPVSVDCRVIPFALNVRPPPAV